MKKKEITTSTFAVNLFSVILLIFSGLIFLGFQLSFYNISLKEINFIPNLFNSVWINSFIYILSITVGVIIHELLHGIVFAFFSKDGFDSIKFGFNAKFLAFYTHCSEKISLKGYRISLLIPCLLLGIFPALVGVLFNLLVITYFGIIFISVASADLWILFLLRNCDSHVLVKDHPSKVGCHVWLDSNIDCK